MSLPRAKDNKINRLRRLLILFFLALLIPTGALLLFAADQMKWETYHQFRQQAESLTNRIDQEIIAITEIENLRKSTDYQFLIVEQESVNGTFRPSPLAQLPSRSVLPGLVGHFQIEADGRLTSPLMPAPGIQNEDYGITDSELNDRRAIANQLRDILISGNLAEKPSPGDPALKKPMPEGAAKTDELQVEITELTIDSDAEEVPRSTSKQKLKKKTLENFDRQTENSYQQNSRRIGSLADLRLDDSLEQRAMSRAETKAAEKIAALADNRPSSPQGRRKEQTSTYDFSKVLPEAETYSKQAASLDDEADIKQSRLSTDSVSAPSFAPETAASAGTPSAAAYGLSETSSKLPRARVDLETRSTNFISSFESEVDPLKLAIFDEDHIVLYRNVWRNNERIIQGAILDREIFIDTLVRRSFLATPLADTSQLLIAFKDDVLNIFGAAQATRYRPSTESLTGSVLYRSKLAEPFNHFSLIFNIDNLPLGAGIKYLMWVAAALLCVLIGGCYFMYKFGKGQIFLYQQQQDFVSAVSHELKTPLTSIRMYSEMLKNSWASDEKKPGYYEYIHSESERLSRLIENVLQLARINRHQSDLQIETIDMGELMANASSKLGSLIDTSNFSLIENFDDEALHNTLQCSQDATLQILINIVDNAVKFSRNADRKEIIVRLSKLSNGAIEIGIRDYGPGIDQTQMKKIFELFYRTENELTRETVGTGIGLALAHQLATGMDAKIDVRNCQPGVEFTITWPAAAVKTKEQSI